MIATALHFGFGKHQLMLNFNHMKKFLLVSGAFS